MAATLGGVSGLSLSLGQLDAQASVLAAYGVRFVCHFRWQPLPQSKVGLILLYLHLSLHLFI